MNTLFEVLAGFTLKKVPDFNSLKSRAEEKWGKEIGGVHPSFIPKKGDEIFFLKPIIKKGAHLHSHEAIVGVTNFGFFLPNATGLILSKEIILRNYSFLASKSEWYILGYDHPKNLCNVPGFGHMVPCLFVKDGKFNYMHLPYKSPFDHDELVVCFKKN